MLKSLLQRISPPAVRSVGGGLQTSANACIAQASPARDLLPSKAEWVDRYPPIDPGIPAVNVDEVLRSQADLLLELKRIVSTSDEAFETRYMRPILALAEQVHLLPASAHDAFSGPGGLFRLSLEIATYSTRAADGRIFTPDANVEARHALEPLWKYGVFLSGLCCELYRALGACTVADREGVEWPKFLTPLGGWLRSAKVDRYFVTWLGDTRGPVSGAEGAAIIGKIIPDDELSRLQNASSVIVRDVMGFALGQTKPNDSILAETVHRQRDRVLQRDEATRRSRYGRLQVGHHLEPYLLDAIRHFVESGKWNAAGESGPIYYGTDGLYVEWPKAFAEVRAHLVSLGIQGVPASATTIAEILGKANAVISQDSGQWLWKIITSEPRIDVPLETTTALRFRDAGALLGMHEPKNRGRPFSESLVVRISEATATASPAVAPANSAAQVYATLPSVANVVTDDHAAAGDRKLSAAAPAPAAAQATAKGESLSAEEGRPAAAGGQPLPDRGGVRPSDAPATSPPRGGTAAPPKSYAAHLPEALRARLRAADAEMLGRWVDQYKSGKTENVCDYSGRQLAVSKDYIESLDLEFANVVATIEKNHWLGRPDGGGRGARVANIQFGDTVKMGVVLTAEAVTQLGFRA